MSEKNPVLARIAEEGVSIWLDDLSRERLTSGGLAQLIDTDSVTGVTTNPTIFAAALAHGEAYDSQVSSLKGKPVAEVIQQLTTTDVRDACDVFAELNKATDGVDGRVSIEVEPGLAHDTDATVAQAKQLHDLVDRPNVLVKIPATKEGLPAIRKTIAAGTSVNVTLIFSIERYREVMDAWMSGLEDAHKAGIDISTIHSVASFFVSRVDTEVDKRLDAVGSDEAKALKGLTGIANARIAYGEWLKTIDTDRWRALLELGAHPQRPLWASTGVKNPDYDDTMYVIQLVADGCVNTMPEKTMQAVADHGRPLGDTITPHIDDAIAHMDKLQALGIDMGEVSQVLEDEGVDKFVASWGELVASVQKALDA